MLYIVCNVLTDWDARLGVSVPWVSAFEFGTLDWWRDSQGSRAFKHLFQLVNCCCIHYTYQHTPCVVAIDDYTHVESATASFMNLVTVAQENSISQKLQPSFGLCNSFP